MAAVGGILGANLVAIIGIQFFAVENQGIYVQPWADTGWYLGTAIFLFGAVTGQLRFINGTSLGNHLSEAVQKSGAGAMTEPSGDDDKAGRDRYGFFRGVLVCGFLGSLLGFFVGANLLIFWFSLAYSPFSPRTVASSVEVVRERQPGTVFDRPVLRSNHPIALTLGLIPTACGALAGAATGGFISLRHSLKNRATT
ncbi:hypothetical protein [Planctopirus hydrillae]|uniref:Uncharacterized protein n=1 Tax=Planctopirus hydrillae TaxID=1841610 RepID=A0A1C3EQK4_9PLAN|nr:hypothetical protein [Planctopirus hydrillae]ODA35525.1 hypothetical protein A6X21_17125 [Planctopirus hydrillae]